MRVRALILLLVFITVLQSSAGILDSKVKLGPTVGKDGTVTFALYAPGKTSVHVTGDFNNWDKTANPMDSDSDGIWTTSVKLNSGEYRYKFILNGTAFIGDPYATDVDWQSFGPNGVVTVGKSPYSWGDSFFDSPPLNDLIIYETHVGDFTSQGTYRAMKDKLPHLKKLGINAIELMPVMEFPGDISWGYNPA
ncbi:MAG: hypothetical protein PHQ23_09420, partial [Candidatus Wallbacteria bacterium]|nr:hypothetical protein [Candidatus Wallbacteria bacterium]